MTEQEIRAIACDEVAKAIGAAILSAAPALITTAKRCGVPQEDIDGFQAAVAEFQRASADTAATPAFTIPLDMLANYVASSNDRADNPIVLPLANGGEYVVTSEKIMKWEEDHPAVDVIQELRRIRGWLLGNPRWRKTTGGTERFIATWLARAFFAIESQAYQAFDKTEGK